MKTEDLLVDKCQFIIRICREFYSIDISKPLSELMGKSRSEVRRLVSQGAMTVYRRQDVKVKYEKP